MSEGAAPSTRPKRLARVLGAQAALWLPALVAVLSVVTGIVNIGSMNVSGPLAPYVPPTVERTVGFTGVLTGFLMMAAAYGLRNRLRVAWLLTVVLLPVTAVQGLAQASQYSYPLVVVSLVSIPTVLANHRLFDREFDLSTAQLAALLAVVGTQSYGTIGSYVLREEFTGIQSVTDAFYFTLVTASTVGYGDAIPATTSPEARLFTMSLVVLGVASFGVAITTLVGPAIEARFTNALGIMNDSTLDILDNHIIVVGVSDLTEPVIEELATATAPPQFVVITRSPDRAQELRTKDIEVVVADPSDEEPLSRVGIERARALVAATDDDAQDALAILTARELNPELNIVAAATERENAKKLRRAGADTVISPAVIGGHLLVQSAMETGDMESLAAQIMDVPDEDKIEVDEDG
ncbi:NAD-binding protein [Halosegnis longus]|uniref:NAD-binding protein n=1 Tax=Halosegnis longus TaxID=2216012 RepID=UPI00096A921E|nr:NAD-binding protein [Salella cibi]